MGGGGSKRKSYFQVLIRCCGKLPPQVMVEGAIKSSNGGSKRSVLFLKGQMDRPK